MSQPFDFDAALKALQSGQKLTGKDGILTPLIKQLTEAALTAELDSHLAQALEANRRNGTTKKTIKAPSGNFELATPRDRNGTFEPQLVKKHQSTLSDEIEQKIIRMFALGMSYADISREIEDLYAFSVSTATISAVTDKVIPELKQWQQRLLEPVYPFVWLDAIPDEEWIRAVNNKGVYTGGELKGGTVRADGRLSTGEFLQLDKVMVEGTACPTNGLVSRDAKGALLSCQSGVWAMSDGLGQYTIYLEYSGHDSKPLGKHKFCALTAMSIPANPTASCLLDVGEDNQWYLTQRPSGFSRSIAYCKAICF